MRYVTAILGFIFIWIAAFLLLGVIIAAAAPFLLFDIEFMGLHTNNPIGFVLAGLAATASFKATLKRKKKEDDAKAARPSAMSNAAAVVPPPPPARIPPRPQR